MKTYQRSLLILGITSLTFLVMFISFGEAQNRKRSADKDSSASRKTNIVAPPLRNVRELLKNRKSNTPGSPASLPLVTDGLEPYSASAVAFIETPAVRDLRPVTQSREELEKSYAAREDREKNENNVKRVKPLPDPSMTGPFVDPTLSTRFDRDGSKSGGLFPGLETTPLLVTNPIQNFDGPDMDQGAVLFGGRFAPPDTNAAVGPNHVVITCNAGFQIFSKAGVALTPLTRISTLLAGIPGAADDDGDPIVLYDGLADRWLISQFRLTTTNGSTHEHVAISKTSDPTGAYFAYDFLLTPNRFGDYPHLGVWPDGYYMATNDFNLAGTAFLGAGLYALERNKMLVGDPTAKIIGFNTPPTEGGMLPTNLQGFTAPPVNTPNLFIEFDADEFGALTDLIRVFEFRPNYVTPASSTLTQRPDIPVAAFDARNPSSRADIAQPAPGEGLDSIADRLMHAMNFRVLPGGQQSYVLNWTVNVSGVSPTNSATYQGGVRWMELRRNSGSGAITINQQATYAPGSGNGTGRDLWMASVAQDGEGNIGLAANASGVGPALNPTAVYTGRLAGDPVNTLPQGEVDALAAVTKGVQTATANRWGDYSSLFADPADDCTFWAAFEYVDSPTATFDWNTRLFSFKVNPSCVTPARGSFSGIVTNCETALPIEGATVQTSDGFFRTTNAAGQYTVNNIAPGTYSVSITKAGAGFNTVTGMVTVTDGGNSIFNACLQGVPIIAAAGSTITAESCSPANGAVDPGETVTVNFKLMNNGGGGTTNLVATLQATGGVTSPSGPQNYGSIPPGGMAERPFTFTANGTCGGTITATLQLQDGATNLGTVTYTFQIGAVGGAVNNTYSTGNIAVPIPDVSTVEVPINVPDNGVVQDINVRVRLNHTFDGDLVISLVHPDGTTIALSNNRGGSGDNFGTGANDCSGTPTVFDDEAGATIASGVAPFAGSFRPDAPLSGLDGKTTVGAWKLRIADTAALDIGTIFCVTLEINRGQFVCCGVAGTPNIVAGPATLVDESCPPANSAIDPGERVTVNLTLINNGTGSTNNLVATLQSGGGVLAPSDPQSYGVLTATGPGSSASRDFSFTADPAIACGGTITATWQLQDGATNLGTVSKTFTVGTTVSSTTTFSNPAPILIPATGTGASTGAPANPYPSTINVSGLTGTVSKVTVTLKNMNHTFPDDIDVLLVGPGGQKLLLMSDAGGSVDIVNTTYTFDDAAAGTLADAAGNASGTYKPSNFGTTDAFPAPAPAGPYPDPQLLSIFNGVNPNGTWSLYVVDDLGGDIGNINLGWELNITTALPLCTSNCGVVRLVVTSSLARLNATTVQATYQVQNTGTLPANNVMLTTAVLGATNGTPLPQSLGTIAPGATSASMTVNFTNSTPGASSTLKLGGTYTGGTFSSTKRVTVP